MWRTIVGSLVVALAAAVGGACGAPVLSPAGAGGGPAAPAAGAGAASPASAAAPAPAAEAPALARFRLAYPNLSSSYLAMFLAEDLGYYRAEGLELEILEMRANAGQAALMSSEVDFTASLGSNVRMGVQGAPIKTILLFMKNPVFVLTTQPDITSVAGLRGRTIGVGVAGATIDQMARLTVRHYGLEPQQDVQIVSIGDGAVQYEALPLGQIDAAMISPPFPVLAEREGFRSLVYTTDILRLPTSGLGTLQTTLDQRRDQVVRLAKAQIRALRYVRAHPEESAQAIAKFFGMDLETARGSYALMLPAWTADGAVDREGMALLLQQEVADGTVAVAPPYEQLVDVAVAAEAARALGPNAN